MSERETPPPPRAPAAPSDSKVAKYWDTKTSQGQRKRLQMTDGTDYLVEPSGQLRRVDGGHHQTKKERVRERKALRNGR